MVRKVSRRSFLALSAASAGTVLGSRWIEPAIALASISWHVLSVPVLAQTTTHLVIDASASQTLSVLNQQA